MKLSALFELLFSRESGERAERETQDAIRKATDPKQAERNLSAVDRAIEQLSKTAQRVGTALGAMFALNQIRRFGQDSIRIATESIDVWENLGSTIDNLGGSWDQMEARYRAAASAFERSTVYDDDAYARGVQRLTVLTGDHAAAMESMGLAADVAARYYKGNLDPAIEKVGRAMTGQTRQLRELGIVTDDAAEGIRLLAERSMGAAEARTQSFAGRVQQLSVGWDNFKKAIGLALIEAGGGASTIETLTAVVREGTTFINENATVIQSWATTALTQVGRVVRGMGIALRTVRTVVGAIAEALPPLSSPTRPGWTAPHTGTEPGGGTANGTIASILARLKAEREAEEQAERARQGAENARKAAAQEAQRLMAQVDQWRYSQQHFDLLTRLSRGSTQGRTSLVGESIREGNEALIQTRQAGQIAVRSWTDLIAVADRHIVQYSALQNASLYFFSAVEDGAWTASLAITDAFEDAFDLLWRDIDNLGAAFAALGQGLAVGILRGIAQAAKGKAAENFANAIEQTARGLAATAMGNPAAALHYQAAGVFAKAGLAWGVFGGAAGAVTRGGGGNVQSGRQDRFGGRYGGIQPAGEQIIIYVQSSDSYDPRYQDKIVQTIKNASRRDSSIDVRPWDGRR